MIWKFWQKTGVSRQDLTESNRHKQTARKRESRHRYNLCVQWGRCCPCLSLVLRFVRWAAQILQNGPRQLGLLGCVKTDLPCSSNLIGLCPFLSLVLRFFRWAAQILQNGPRQLGLLGCAPCSPSGGPFWPLSSPNPPKRTSPCWSAWLCSLLSRWWSVLAAQQPKSSKMDLLSALDLLSCVCSPAGVPFWLLAARIHQSGPPYLICAWYA